MDETDPTPRIHVPPTPPGTVALRPPSGGGDRKTVRLDPAPAVAETLEPLATQYAVLEKIGDGGMGVVYLARDRQLGRYVAIKRLNSESMTRAALKERFLREAKAIAALNHIHIVHVYALGDDRDGPYIVMEYISGPPDRSPDKTPPHPFTLADKVHRDGPLTVNDALDLIIKLCRAIEYAHSCGVIHRDLKPSNVLLDESGEPKVVDFGLARLVGPDDEHLTVPGEKMLSVGYGAPEQETDASQVDERADVYGLGALLYFGITGQNPRYFRENTVPEALKTPIVKSLATDRDERWSSVKEFTAALTLVKAPSTIELPTVRATWRCRWCDTVNPVAIKYCGECGWDGGVICAECGSEMRVGIQFCGDCGADAREYEAAGLLHGRLTQQLEVKRFGAILEQWGQVSTFTPVGPAGQKLVREVHALRERAEQSLARREALGPLIRDEVATENYERARVYINEYDTLAADGAFSAELERLPSLTAVRDLKRARRAMRNEEWEYAEQKCRGILDSLDPDNTEAAALLRTVLHQRWRRRLRQAAVATLLLFLLYVASAPPVYLAWGERHRPAHDIVFASAIFLHDATVFGQSLEHYAELWGATDMYKRPHRRPTGTTGGEGPDPQRVDRLTALTGEYDRSLTEIQTEYQAKLSAWPGAYVDALKDLQQKRQKSGDFEGWAAVKAEIARFAEDPGLLPEDDTTDTVCAELGALQHRFRGQLGRYRLERSRKLLASANRQLAALAGLQKKLTIQGEMDEAAEVNTEIKRVRSSPEFLAAEAEVQAANAETARDGPS